MSERCTSTAIMPSGWYRCVYETGHWGRCPEHYYNYWRAFTDEERQKFFPEESEAPPAARATTEEGSNG